ncbi:NAD-dependent epimerase/dehydratase family protein [Bacillus carboniphilus]|uniref:dTDP-4-dehydrorhamnose reductase n=1 Tax=Bacillus carboniphilus TaxID=86663 RepID=A0ABY9JSE5_9BACI|nr:NAD-dependent epimerase/dehydratase family protein [Bacillus carboniphilus]WLR42267.1 NAD-dependent epimerase/dehydratase family protein [Bacillus carboniphilus]
MKYLILGATGFLGSTIHRLAEKSNYTVLGTSRYENEKENIIKLDVMDTKAVEQLIQKYMPDAVVWSLLSMDKEDVLINVGLTNLLTSISEQTKLIFLSTDGVFTDGQGGHIESDKTSPLAEEAPLATYVNSKITGEKLVQSEHRNHIIIRTGPLYGKGSDQNIEQRTQRVMKEVEDKDFFHAATNIYRTFVHIDDLSKVILELSSIDFKGKLHVGPLQKESYYTFYKKRLKSFGYDENVIKPSIVNSNQNPHILMDTSLNTHRVNNLPVLRFRTID